MKATAFVTGADHPTGLGSARALRAAGARVVGFADDPENAACRSRAWSEVRSLSGRNVEDVVGELVAQAESSTDPIFLLPTQDTLVDALSRMRGRLPDHVRTCLPDADVVDVLLMKTRFAAWAAERGYPVPATRVLESLEELEAALAGFTYPAVLKPLVRSARWGARSPIDKVYFLEGPADVRRIPFDLFEAAPAYVLSEWIRGEDHDVLFCLVYLDQASEVVAGFTGRKLVQSPRFTGSSAACVGIECAELAAMTGRLFKEAGCTGLASLEVKRSSVDGRLLITEPTVGRPNLQSPAALCSGLNLVGIAMRRAFGLDYADLLKPERRCVWFQEQAIYRLLTSGQASRLPYRLIAGEVLRTRRVAGTFCTASDPAPLLGLLSEWTGRRLKKLRAS